MRIFTFLLLFTLPLTAFGQSPLPAAGQPTAIQPSEPAIDLPAGRLFRLPGRTETYIVEPDGNVRPARLDEAAAPSVGERAAARTGKLVSLIMLIAMLATYLARRPDVMREWFGNRPTVARLAPLVAAGVATVGIAYAAGSSWTEAIEMAIGGGLGAIGSHQVLQGAQKSFANRVDAKVAAAMPAESSAPAGPGEPT